MYPLQPWQRNTHIKIAMPAFALRFLLSHLLQCNVAHSGMAILGIPVACCGNATPPNNRASTCISGPYRAHGSKLLLSHLLKCEADFRHCRLENPGCLMWEDPSTTHQSNHGQSSNHVAHIAQTPVLCKLLPCGFAIEDLSNREARLKV